MMASTKYNIDPKLDLMLERVIDVPRSSYGRRGRRRNTW